MHCNVATFQKGNKKQEMCKFRTFLSIMQSIARDRQLQMVECDMDSWIHGHICSNLYCKEVKIAHFRGIKLDCWPEWMDFDCGLWMDPTLYCCEVSWGYTTGLRCSLQGAAARRSLTRIRPALLHFCKDPPASQHATPPALLLANELCWRLMQAGCTLLARKQHIATQQNPTCHASAEEGEDLNSVELLKSHHIGWLSLLWSAG